MTLGFSVMGQAQRHNGVLWNAFKKIASGFSPGDKAALFHDTATRVYRVET